VTAVETVVGGGGAGELAGGGTGPAVVVGHGTVTV
jgi:hypothetical protein